MKKIISKYIEMIEKTGRELLSTFKKNETIQFIKKLVIKNFYNISSKFSRNIFGIGLS